MNPLPFLLDQHAFRIHAGLSRCSVTAKELWLDILEESYCLSHLHWEAVHSIAMRNALDDSDILVPFSELLSNRVCAFFSTGDIAPIAAEYLQADFWTKLRRLPT